MKKKHSFILLELLIALSILSSFALPLMSSRFLYMKKEKKWLMELEKERIAEKLFYDVCKNLTEKHPLGKIERSTRSTYLGSFPAITIDLGRLNTKTFHVHYHLYSMSTKTLYCRKIFCKFCFNETQQQRCLYNHDENAQYLFIFSGENLRKIQKEHQT